MARVEPPIADLQVWADGDFNIHVPIPAQYANWAYWYLGWDEPDFKAGEPISNGMIVKLTDACILRLKELNG